MTDRLISGFEGTLYSPGDDGYDEVRLPWLRNHDSRPALVALAKTVADVERAVRYANEQNLPIAIQASGHGAAKPTDGALLIKTQALKEVTIDAAAQTATFESGVTAGELVTAAAAYNLAPITGDSPYVGAVGFTIGGGHGWLSRQYGFAADSIVSAQLITATGAQLTVDATTHPDLFWGIKGGSGNFGVIVSLTVRLHPVVRGLAGGLYFDAAHAEALIERYRQWIPELPETHTAFLQAVTLPPIPQLPEEIRAKRVVTLQFFFNDESPAAEVAIQSFMQSLDCVPLLNTTSRMTYAELLAAAPNIPPTATQGYTGLQAALTDAQIPELAKAMQTAEGNPIIQIRPWGGALAAAQDDALLQYDDVGYSVYVAQSIKGALTDSQAHFAEIAERMRHYASGKAFLNLTADPTAMQHAYSESAKQKLQTLKNSYDPKNLLRFGHTL